METLITKLYGKEGVKTTTFEPVHSKGLSNEFFCYANFESEKWKWRSGGGGGENAVNERINDSSDSKGS